MAIFGSARRAVGAAGTAGAGIEWPDARRLLVRLKEGADGYAKLCKHKLSALVVYTGAVGFVMGSTYAASGQVEYRKMAWFSFGTGLCAASANALNQLYEVDRDALMRRTMRRPLVTGKISKVQGLVFALATGLAGTTVLAETTDTTTASLGLANILLYAGVYTPLKVVHPVNTWVGAVVGAIPPMMGWSAATGGDLSHTQAWLLGALLFVWQIPHFHALGAVCAKDYTAGGYRMLAQVEPKLNAKLAAWMAYSMLPLGPLAVHTKMTTAPFAVEALGLNLWIVHGAERFLRNPKSTAAARPLFLSSITYLPLVLGAMMFHRRTDIEPAKDQPSNPPPYRREYQTIFLSWPFFPCPVILTDRSNPIADGEPSQADELEPTEPATGRGA